MKRAGVAAGIALITALTWFAFPGHTWLQQDTQIYVPAMEHLSDPSVLRNDMLAQAPQLTFTLYDETARALRWATRLSLRDVLEGEQQTTRALGVWGLYLIAAALGLSAPASLFVAAVVSLGATIGGPAVLSFEIEPDPRGFAVPLLFLAIGLSAHRRSIAASLCASAAFLIHPPTALPVCLILSGVAAWKRRWLVLAILGCSCLVLFAVAFSQPAGGASSGLFARVEPWLEALQRMRAPYSYVSQWGRAWLPRYLALYCVAMLALVRTGRATSELRAFLIGLPLIGMLSVPASWLLLEGLKWAPMPQIQPMRALLFVTVFAQLLAAMAGIAASESGRYAEALVWFGFAYLIPIQMQAAWPSWSECGTAASLAGLACIASRRVPWRAPALLVASIAGFVLIPAFAAVRIHPELHTAELTGLCAWAAANTAPDAVFLFADAGKQLTPGIFRAEASRAVYVDWKSGGQVNYSPQFAREWWTRWQATLALPFDPRAAARYKALGINYLIVALLHRIDGCSTVYENASYLACAL